VLRVTTDHYHLMKRWWELLQSDIYQDFQRRAWQQRPLHMLGDQDVLTALLASKEFSEVPIHILRRGKDILQFNGVYGYTVAERVKTFLGECSAFVHSFAGKPWSERWQLESPIGLREYLKKVYLDVSPYTQYAMKYKDELESDTDWMEPHYVLSRILRALGMGRPPLVGLPLAAFMDLTRIMKWILKSHRSNTSLLETNSPGTASNR
jgi:hypothetical protein